MEVNYNYERVEGGKPIKHWTKGVILEDTARQQLYNISRIPFIHKHVAVMPDVHWGNGATIGSVIATKGAIIPAAVGVDIGCGMMAVKTSLTANNLPDNLHTLRNRIEHRIPHGRTHNGRGSEDKGAHSLNNIPVPATGLVDKYIKIIEKHPNAKASNIWNHMGTLGTGNHFIEICLDEHDSVWVMLHSGSRGPGNRIGSYFINKAKEEMERYHITPYLPDKNLAYLVEHTEIFDDYVDAVSWAQDFALANRTYMMDQVLSVMVKTIPTPFSVVDTAVNCHHNYIDRENHFGSNVWVTRKGAVRARKTDLGIIPGSMGTGSFIVRGLGNKDSFCSCSHGAGRSMSRGQAKKEISLIEHTKAMEGIEARLDLDVLDESPAAYKNINDVMEAQHDLIEIVHSLHQVLNVKG